MTTFLTADLHIDHNNLMDYEPERRSLFHDLEGQRRELILRHNAVVSPTDTIIVVGDLALSEKNVGPYLAETNGRKVLVSGNHDRTHSCHKKYQNAIRRYLAHGFAEVHEQLELGRFLVCHMPYVADERHGERYSQWRPKDEGKWLLHGHVHSAWRTRDRMINVGVDVWDYRPVSLEEIERLAVEA
jgi:calcineurin-like phosphoesterase family protein